MEDRAGVLKAALDIAILVTLWAAVAGHVLAVDRSAALAPIRLRRGLVARVVAWNLLVMPPVAAAAARVVGLDDAFTTGLVLLAAASGGAIAIAVVQVARGDVALTLALVVILEVANVVAIPAWAALLLPRSVDVSVLDVLRALVVYVLLPVAASALARAVLPSIATRLARPAEVVAGVGLIVVVVLVIALHGPLLGPSIASGGPIATLLLVAAGLGGGWLVAGGERGGRVAAGLVTAQRSGGVALAVATASFGDVPGAAVAVVVGALIVLAATAATAFVLRRAGPTLHPVPARGLIDG